jgi:hypothetical protein
LLALERPTRVAGEGQEGDIKMTVVLCRLFGNLAPTVRLSRFRESPGPALAGRGEVLYAQRALDLVGIC